MRLRARRSAPRLGPWPSKTRFCPDDSATGRRRRRASRPPPTSAPPGDSDANFAACDPSPARSARSPRLDSSVRAFGLRGILRASKFPRSIERIEVPSLPQRLQKIGELGVGGEPAVQLAPTAHEPALRSRHADSHDLRELAQPVTEHVVQKES